MRVREHVRAHLRAAFELHAQAEPQADAVRRAHAQRAVAETRRYPPPVTDRDPDRLVHRALSALASDERVRLRVHGERRDLTGRIVACGAGEPRHGIARELTLHDGRRVHVADVASIRHATARLRDRHDPRLAACAHQFGHRGHCLTKSRGYSTTFTALREARYEHVLRQRDAEADGRRRPARARRRVTARADRGAALRRPRSLHSRRRAARRLGGRQEPRKTADRSRGVLRRSARAGEDDENGGCRVGRAR